MTDSPRATIVSLGCSRNDVDSEELAGRLSADGWVLTEESQESDVILINTCGFVEQAKKDSIDTILQAAGLREDGSAKKVVAVGCLAQRYGKDLAAELPEADAILGFDHYPQIGQTLREVLDGASIESHEPSDRRTLLPISPVDRAAVQQSEQEVVVPGNGPHVYRTRLNSDVWSPLKIASGCDRRCTFCAIPMFRGSYVSRTPTDIISEAQWLAAQGVKELLLVSENSTSYGKDLGDIRLLEKLLPELAQIDGIEWVRVSYLQPAEIRPDLLAVIAQTPSVVPYFDLSFQHSSPSVLRNMKRFGGTEAFLGLIEQIRTLSPEAGIRTNVIVGFPGETEDDVDELEHFLNEALLDVVGVFGYSDEDGTGAVSLPNHLDDEVVRERVERISSLVDHIAADVAASRIGSEVDVLIETVNGTGRSAHQGPEVDGATYVSGTQSHDVGRIVRAVITDSEGADLYAQVSESAHE